MTEPLPDEVNIDCPYQKPGMGKLICAGANTRPDHTTNEVTPQICSSCHGGRIYREVGCDAFTPEILLLRTPGGIHPYQFKSFCIKRKRETTFEYCQRCTLVSAPTTKEITATVKGLFESENFSSAFKDLEDARKGLRDGDYDGTIRSSVSCLESVMKLILDKTGSQYPADQSITSLWKAVKRPLQLDVIAPIGTVDALLGTLTGTVSHLGGMRNQISDAHGRGEIAPEVPYMLAELAINTASTLATLLVRRYVQLSGEGHE